ncbi:glycosyltransferase [Microbacterium phage Rasputia]|nr:glycosyltransferase [Microbacterium phage Rasputia]
MKIHILHVPGADAHRDEVVATYAANPDIDVCVHADPERRGIMVNWLEAAQCALDDAHAPKWSIIIQDDAVGGPGWVRDVEEACWFSPAPVLGMSYFGKITESAFKRGYPYMVGPHLIWGAAVAYRRDFLEGLVPWAREVFERTEYQHDDRLISAYANKIGVDTALTVRAIFDQPVEKSTVGHAGGGERRPKITIWGNSGAPYGSRPRALRTKAGAAKDQRDWLASLGTPDEHPTHAFVKTRSGAVQWMRKS